MPPRYRRHTARQRAAMPARPPRAHPFRLGALRRRSLRDRSMAAGVRHRWQGESADISRQVPDASHWAVRRSCPNCLCVFRHRRAALSCMASSRHSVSPLSGFHRSRPAVGRHLRTAFALQGSACSPPRRAGLAPRKSAEQAMPDRPAHVVHFALALCSLLTRRACGTRGALAARRLAVAAMALP